MTMSLRALRLSASAGLAVLFLLAAGCSDSSRLIDEKNPWFNKGSQFRKENKYREAAEAFEKCLRVSPDSAKAHLQLGVLYEDNLADPLAAVFNYRSFLAKRPDAENASMVRGWLSRAEETYLRELAVKYPEVVKSLDLGVTDRERMLAAQVKKMNDEILMLRKEMQVMTAGGRPAGGAAVAGAGAAGATAGGAAKSAGAEKTHTVKSGETLMKVSAAEYGTSKYWIVIRDANQDVLKGKEALSVGMKLRIPPKPAETKTASKTKKP